MKKCMVHAIFAMACCGISGVVSTECHAGLFDWIFPGRTYPAGAYGAYYPGYYNTYYGGYGGYNPYAQGYGQGYGYGYGQ